jgi:membrane-associated protease RseP (regulator of RpoE activity)
LSEHQKDLEDVVRSLFKVRETFVLPEGELEFQVEYDGATKENFLAAKAALDPLGFRPDLTGKRDDCILTLRKIEPPLGKLPTLPVFLVLFTLASVAVFGLLQESVYSDLVPSMSPYFVFFGFVAPTAIVMGAHELGQRAAARRRGGGHSNIYLIPGIPYVTSFLPSLGFAISQREPGLNRDRLFDTVVAGPLALLALSVILYIVGDLTSVQSAVPFAGSQIANNTISIYPNVIQLSVDALLLRPAAPGYILLSPIADGATVGFILAFIGLLPMASYDGGFLANIAWGQRGARLASYLSVLALLVLDTPTYWALAIVALILAGRPFQIKLLDDVSPLSSTRQWIFIGTLVLAFLCLPLPQNLATFPLA